MEEVHGMECFIKEPTRITTSTETLIDIILTNKPHLFEQSGVLFPEISDHGLIYGLMKEKVYKHQNKIITCRSTKNLNVKKFNEDLKTAPWHVGEIFGDINDKHFF